MSCFLGGRHSAGMPPHECAEWWMPIPSWWLNSLNIMLACVFFVCLYSRLPTKATWDWRPWVTHLVTPVTSQLSPWYNRKAVVINEWGPENRSDLTKVIQSNTEVQFCSHYACNPVGETDTEQGMTAEYAKAPGGGGAGPHGAQDRAPGQDTESGKASQGRDI